jgi:hypothetical protein
VSAVGRDMSVVATGERLQIRCSQGRAVGGRKVNGGDALQTAGESECSAVELVMNGPDCPRQVPSPYDAVAVYCSQPSRLGSCPADSP